MTLDEIENIGPTLDVDWRNNVSFATSSTDTMIYLCKIGETRPVKVFAGHQVVSLNQVSPIPYHYVQFFSVFKSYINRQMSRTNHTRGFNNCRVRLIA